MKITTKGGFKFELDDRITDDWRVLRAISKADNSSNPEEMIAGTVELVSLIFGKDENRLIEHIKAKNDGFVPMSVLKDELLSTLTRANSLKKSQSSQV